MISTLGCLEQHRFCTAKSRICTPFLGWGQVQAASSFLSSLTPLQSVTFARTLRAAEMGSITVTTVYIARTSTPLLAIDQCAAKNTVLSLDLPDNQWQLELQYWYSIVMAAFQRTLVQWATGQIAIDPKTQLRPPETSEERWFCENLLIPSEVYQSFSVLGVVLILFFGVLIIIVASTVESMTAFVRKCCGHNTNRASWNDQDVLNLFDRDKKCEKGPLPPPKDFHTVKDSESGRLQTAQINTNNGLNCLQAIEVLIPDAQLFGTTSRRSTIMPHREQISSHSRTTLRHRGWTSLFAMRRRSQQRRLPQDRCLRHGDMKEDRRDMDIKSKDRPNQSIVLW